MRFALFAISLVCITTSTALAQRAPDRAVTFGVFGGRTATVTSGDVPPTYDANVHGGALAEFRTPVRWLALRADGSIQRLGRDVIDVTDVNGRTLYQFNQHVDVMAASANAVARLPALRSRFQPYAIAGVTAFRTKSRVFQASGPSLSVDAYATVQHQFSPNIGLGVDAPLGRAQLFVEARYARMGPVIGLLPISVGMKWR